MILQGREEGVRFSFFVSFRFALAHSHRAGAFLVSSLSLAQVPSYVTSPSRVCVDLSPVVSRIESRQKSRWGPSVLFCFRSKKQMIPHLLFPNHVTVTDRHYYRKTTPQKQCSSEYYVLVLVVLLQYSRVYRRLSVVFDFQTTKFATSQPFISYSVVLTTYSYVVLLLRSSTRCI